MYVKYLNVRMNPMTLHRWIKRVPLFGRCPNLKPWKLGRYFLLFFLGVFWTLEEKRKREIKHEEVRRKNYFSVFRSRSWVTIIVFFIPISKGEVFYMEQGFSNWTIKLNKSEKILCKENKNFGDYKYSEIAEGTQGVIFK